MSTPSGTIMVARPPLNLLDKAATLLACALAGVVFVKVGWRAMEPADPLGAVSVLARPDGWWMLIQAGALATVIGGLATLIAGRKLADIGAFATALGLVLVSLRGGNTESLLIQGVDGSEPVERSLALRFLIEALGWFLVMVMATGASAVVMRWRFGRPDKLNPDEFEWSSMTSCALAGYDVPGVSARAFGVLGDRQTAALDGVKHSAIATGTGLAAMAVLSASLSSRSIQHGQVCFVLVASVCIATYVACRLVPVRSALWAILSVVLMALAGYAWSVLRPATPGLPPNIPSSHFMRALPIQFIAAGTAAALMTFWSMYVPVLDRQDDAKAVARASRQGSR